MSLQPFIVYENGKILNLAQVVKVIDNVGQSNSVYLSNGEKLVLTGNAANVVKQKVMIHFQTHDAMMKEIVNPSQIVPANNLQM